MPKNNNYSVNALPLTLTLLKNANLIAQDKKAHEIALALLH